MRSGEKRKIGSEDEEEKIQRTDNPVKFCPPVYVQRYKTVESVLNDDLWKDSIKKVVDYGCNDFKFFKFIKDLPHINYICGVDIDEEALQKARYKAKPLPYTYIMGHNHKLLVQLFLGSIAEPDQRLLDCDAVIGIELIEHLYPETLEKVPVTVFEYIRPKLAVFTTPNADFNVLFNLEKFRHDDHKFEWTRREFADWCHTQSQKYNYNVQFHQIGVGPHGTEYLGGCSQMAIFIRNEDCNITQKPYKLVESYEYPFQADDRTNEEKFTDEIRYRVNRAVMNKSFLNEKNINEIPVDYLWQFLTEWSPTLDDLIFKLTSEGYDVKKKNDQPIIEVEEFEVASESSDEIETDYQLSNSQLNDSSEYIEENWED